MWQFQNCHVNGESGSCDSAGQSSRSSSRTGREEEIRGEESSCRKGKSYGHALRCFRETSVLQHQRSRENYQSASGNYLLLLLLRNISCIIQLLNSLYLGLFEGDIERVLPLQLEESAQKHVGAQG